MAGEFFQRYLPDPRLFRGFRHIQDAIDVYAAAKHPLIAARLEDELKALLAAIESRTAADAVSGTRHMRERLRARLVRPVTSGPHLASRIVAEPLPTELPAGAIGYGDIKLLDEAIDPDYPRGGTYWRAQEYGSDHAVGRIIVGFFSQPGGFAAPSGAEFRRHAMFTPASQLDGGGGGPAMRIQRPIEAKHFLRDGSAESIVQHEGHMQRLQGDAIATMLAVTSGRRTR